MSAPRREEYLAHLRALYASGLKERENDVALYDSYLENMHAGTTLHALVDAVLTRQPVAHVLDIGCGDGGMLRALVLHYGARVRATGLDLVAPQNAAPPVTFLTGDAVRERLPDDCDVVVSFRAMHEIGALDAMLPAVARTLAPHGRAYLSIRIAEFRDGRIEPQGAITPRDVQYARTVFAARRVAGVTIRGEEIVETARIRLPESGEEGDLPYVRGLNVWMERAPRP